MLEFNYLVNMAMVKQYKPIAENLKIKLLEPHIREAQLFDLSPILCDVLGALETPLAASECFNETTGHILDDWEAVGLAAGTVLEAKWISLQKLVIPVMVHYTYARYVSEAGVRVSRTNISQKIDEYADRVGDKTIERLKVDARSVAASYAGIMIEFIDANPEDYPERCPCATAETRGGITITGF